MRLGYFSDFRGRLDLLFCFRLGSELLLPLEGNGIGIYFVGGSRFAQNNGGIGASRCQKNNGLHQQTRERIRSIGED